MDAQWKSYGQALYELAAQEQLDTELLEQLETLEKVFSSEPDFLRLLSAPNLSKEERCAVVDSVLGGKVHPYICNTLSLLTRKGAARHFGSCIRQYRALYDDDHGIVAVTALTAVALTQAQTSRLSEKLESVTGKTVRITNVVDPSCMGGVRLDFDGKRLDGTVKNRLAMLSDHLKNTVL